jgi:hypothetical protein
MTLEPARWWVIRPAANRQAKTYRCPLCGGQLPALMAHVLLLPEGDGARRRHAHQACVAQARARGRLVLREEWLASQPRPPGLWQRLRQRWGRGRDTRPSR